MHTTLHTGNQQVKKYLSSLLFTASFNSQLCVQQASQSFIQLNSTLCSTSILKAHSTQVCVQQASKQAEDHHNMLKMMKMVAVLLILLSACSVLADAHQHQLHDAKFPSGFLWGSATAAYQVEGAWNISKGLSIWDVFSHTPGKVADNYTGDVADDNYHRYLEDIQLMKAVGFNAYRFSISWPRLFPTGVPPANPDGFDHYNNSNALLDANIVPFVTLYHWDLPNDLPNTWLNESIQEAYAGYASACFAAFGDRVKHWITFNEPLSVTLQGYQSGASAPGRCSDRSICTEGNSTTEESVDIYRTKFQPTQKGVIGITLDCTFSVPLNESSQADIDASERHLEFEVGWFADPIFFGDYPEVMKTYVGDRLPVFTDAQKQLLDGSYDFFGLNHYTTTYAANQPNPPAQSQGWGDDQQVIITIERDGVPIGPQADSSWLQVVPWGMRKTLNWVADRYGNPPLYITENGVDVPNEGQIPLPQVLNDQFRIDYFTQYLSNASVAFASDGVDIRGYFAWSLMDNFEWASGYTKRFGLHYVDYNNNLTRYAKESAKWWTGFIASQIDN